MVGGYFPSGGQNAGRGERHQMYWRHRGGSWFAGDAPNPARQPLNVSVPIDPASRVAAAGLHRTTFDEEVRKRGGVDCSNSTAAHLQLTRSYCQMKSHQVLKIGLSSARYPASLKRYLGFDAPRTLEMIGDFRLLERPTLGLICSVRCPGNVILDTYHFMEMVPHDGPVIIGGFHSPMERKCLEVLLRRKIPIIVCPARSIARIRLRREWKEALAEHRLLVISPFAETLRRPSRSHACFRNRLVAALAEKVLVPHATPGGTTEKCVRDVVKWRKGGYTMRGEDNAALLALGLQPVDSSEQLLARRERRRPADGTCRLAPLRLSRVRE